MEQFVLELNQKALENFATVSKKYPRVSYDVSKNVPHLFTVKFMHQSPPATLLTFKYEKGGLLDIHAEVEGRILRKTNTVPQGVIPKLNGSLSVNMEDDGIFDVQIRFRVTEKGVWKYTITKKPQSIARQMWMNVRISKVDSMAIGNPSNITNLDYLLSIFAISVKAMNYLPFALTLVRNANGVPQYRFCDNFVSVASEGIEKLMKAEHEKHRFDGWDVVSLSWEQFEKSTNLVEELDQFENLPLNEFAVRLHEKNKDELILYYTVHKVAKEVVFSVELPGVSGQIADAFLIREVQNPLTGKTSLKYELEGEAEGEYKEDDPIYAPVSSMGNIRTVDALFSIFSYVSSFMLNYKDETMDVEERTCEVRSEKKQAKKHHRGSVRLFKSYTLKKGWKTGYNRKKAEIHCPAWGVRGHFRHYKNGKVIFVESYVKGKERAKYAGKDYVLLPQAQ